MEIYESKEMKEKKPHKITRRTKKKKLVYTQLYKTPPKLPPLNRHQGEQKNGLKSIFF